MTFTPLSRISALPVAEHWFSVEPRANGIVQIRESWVDPYLTGDLWLVLGRDRSLLIDTGTGIVSPRSTIDALAPGPLLAIVTNGWYDHAGGLHAFDERICHPAEAEIIAAPTATSSVADVYVSEDMLRALPRAGYSTAEYAMRGTTPTRTVTDGELIDLGDRQLQVLHMPGDTPGHIVLFESASGTLFTGDTLFDDPEPHLRASYRTPFRTPGERARRQRGANLGRLAALPAHTVCAGHFGQFSATRVPALVSRM